MRNWLRFGIIFGIIGIPICILYFVYAFTGEPAIAGIIALGKLFYYVRWSKIVGIPNGHPYIAFPIIIITYFGIGVLIGFIIDKIKNKK